MDPHEYDAIMRTLIAIAQHQDTINDDLRAMLRGHDALLTQQVMTNERLAAAIERLDVTQARIEALLARMIAHGDNGQEA